MDAAFTSAPLPSLSPLTGTVRPNTAVEFYEKAFQDQRKLSRRWSNVPGGADQSLPRTPGGADAGLADDAYKLREAAAKHVSIMERAPRTPYHRALTPSQRENLQQEVAKKLHELAHHMHEASQQAQASGQQQDAVTPAPGQPNGQQLRPSTSLPRQDVVMERPGSKCARVRRLPGSSSWSGPLSNLAEQQQQRPLSRMSTPKIRKGTPLLRQSSPAVMALLTGAARPGTSSRSRLGGAQANVWTNAEDADCSEQQQPWTQAGPSSTASLPQRPSSTAAPFVQRPCTTAARHQSGVPERTKPTRGTLFSVFQDLDRFGEGRITYSVFEEAALLIGMREEQARRVYNMMDTNNNGFVTARDWGNPSIDGPLSDFARLYVQVTRGTDGRYKGAFEIDSLYAALQMALAKLKLKNSGRSVSHQSLLQAFSFIDRDGNGSLDKLEVMDAFNSMGIYVKQQVLEEAMRTFDADSDGHIDYSEFVKTLFPNLSKGYKMEA